MTEINYSAVQHVPLILSGIKDLGTGKSGFREMSLLLKDEEGNTYRADFRTRTIYDDNMKKAFRRIIPRPITDTEKDSIAA